jgi:hypothetical protein
VLVVLCFCGCATLTPEGKAVVVTEAPQSAASKSAMPAGCRLVVKSEPVWRTELELKGQRPSFLAERNQAAAAGANALLVLFTQTGPRRDFECPAASPITDCAGSSGADFRVVFESYSCTPDALKQVNERNRPKDRTDF